MSLKVVIVFISLFHTMRYNVHKTSWYNYPMNTTDLITVQQVVELTNKSDGIIWRAIRNGELAIVRKFRPILLSRSDVIEWAKPKPPIISKETLEHLYLDKKQSIKDISKSTGVTPMVIHRLMINFGIPRRTTSQALKGHNPFENISDEKRKQWREKMSINHKGCKLDLSDEERSARSIRITQQNKQPWSDARQEKQRLAHAGDKCWRWRGGSNHYRGPNWQQQRRAARKRDNYTCQRCGITEAELGQNLDAHHILLFSGIDDFEEANRLSNLICYCKRCHAIVEHETNG
jgi:5-methylcytosine-specific restriction endonuclease McrA/predicted DNA-binding transcriptional regulator AlpA